MGAKLAGYFEQISKELGPLGRMNLALLTSISSANALTETDSPANIQVFEKAMVELRKTAKK
jgi:hypothetical protein